MSIGIGIVNFYFKSIDYSAEDFDSDMSRALLEIYILWIIFYDRDLLLWSKITSARQNGLQENCGNAEAMNTDTTKAEHGGAIQGESVL